MAIWAVNERLFDKPMGLYARHENLYMATRYQIWQLEIAWQRTRNIKAVIVCMCPVNRIPQGI